MKVEYKLIKVPQLGANDNSATLIDIFVNDGKKVLKGDLVCCLETAKATFDIEAEHNGYISFFIDIGKEVKTSEDLAILCKKSKDVKKLKNEYLQNHSDSKRNSKQKKDVILTKKAQQLLSKSDVDINNIKHDGIIREKDIKSYLNSLNNEENVKKINNNSLDLVGNKKLAKELMLESMNTIPQSYIEKTIDFNNIESKIKSFIYREKKIVTVLSLLISALSKALLENKFFNSYRKENKLFFYNQINIGVVINHEDKLSIAVIKNANELKPVDIVLELMRIRKDLAKNKPNIEDLSGGTCTISAMDHTEIKRFIPIVHPQQAIVIALPSLQEKNLIDENGKIIKSKYINMGLSFDHSYLDAIKASEFINQLEKNMNDIVEKM